MNLFRRILFFSWVLVLLFALSGKTIHILTEHQHEKLCTETETHFHEEEHSCFICEFDFQAGDGSQHITPAFASLSSGFSENTIYTEFVFTQPHFSFSSRGPPAVLLI